MVISVRRGFRNCPSPDISYVSGCSAGMVFRVCFFVVCGGRASNQGLAHNAPFPHKLEVRRIRNVVGLTAVT